MLTMLQTLPNAASQAIAAAAAAQSGATAPSARTFWMPPGASCRSAAR